MAERFSAFSFVDRIAQVEPGVRAVGRYAIPGDLRRFPSALVAEAIGQLAAWAGMAKLGFRRRPVAGLAGEIAYLGVASPGDLLELAVEIETCDEDAIAYGGAARVNGVPLLELKHCVGPMLAMEDFDDAGSDARGFRDAVRDGRTGADASDSSRRRRSKSSSTNARHARCERRCAYPNRRRSSAIISRAARCFPGRCCYTARSSSRWSSRAKALTGRLRFALPGSPT